MDTSKIIKGVVGGGRYTVTAPIVKEDYGLYLQIEGIELPSTYEVDFSNSEHNGTSVTMIGNADGVLIPSQFISSGKDVFAFLYHVGADYGRTVYKFRIPNKVRPDRTNEEPTPEEQSTIDQAITALNSAVAQTARDVIDADASAQSASQSAENAHDSAVDAQNYAESAQTSANNASASASQASTSATASAQSASQSAQIKADVEDLVDEAQGYAQESELSATASANFASDSQGYAQSASASANSASGYASQADISANTASNKASEASTSAQTASQKATEASQSASQALSYKTDAESAKTASQTAQGLAESARDTAVSAKTDAESARDDAETARDEAQSAVASISGALAEKAPIITDTASGAIASFPDGADNIPLKSLVVDINPIQDLSHGDPSPENLCPISGWTEVDVEQRGVNVWDEEWEVGRINPNTGENHSQNDAVRSKNYIPCIQNTEYYYQIPSGKGNIQICFYDADKSYVGFYDFTTVHTFVTPSNCRYMRFCTGAYYGTTYNYDISINYPSTDHSYHPYTGRSITINLGQTVYGGKLDVLKGELVVDRAMHDMASFPWTYDGVRWQVGNIADIKNYSARSADIIFEKYATNTAASTATEYAGFTVGKAIYIYTSDSTNSPTGSVVYYLATPIAIQLTPNQVNSLLGVNNIWADSGDTEVEYRADTKLYIAKKIAEAIASLT